MFVSAVFSSPIKSAGAPKVSGNTHSQRDCGRVGMHSGDGPSRTLRAARSDPLPAMETTLMATNSSAPVASFAVAARNTVPVSTAVDCRVATCCCCEMQHYIYAPNEPSPSASIMQYLPWSPSERTGCEATAHAVNVRCAASRACGCASHRMSSAAVTLSGACMLSPAVLHHIVGRTG
jgi:hypothetical protein